jgi:predicted RNA-binding Zn ribbon-like protein
MEPDGRTPGRTRITPQLRELRFDVGSLALYLSATVGRRATSRIERLGEPALLAAWCAGVGLVLRAGEDTELLLAQLHELREATYAVLRSVVHDRDPQADAVAVVNRMSTAALPVPVLEARGARVSTAALTGRQVCATVARDLLGVLADPERRGRLRECDSELCRMIYLDAQGGRPRRWCSTRCGNVMKVAHHRARNRADES